MHQGLKISVAVLCFIVAAVIVYQFPLQRALALNAFEDYTTEQGISEEKIESKQVFKDWVRGGYLIKVNFSDDPNYTYYYHYFVWTHKRNENLKFDVMDLGVTDEINAVELDFPCEHKCKYPPLEK